MFRKVIWKSIVGTLMFSLLLASCGAPATTPVSQPTVAPAELKVALLVNGSINDGGFNQSGYLGLKAIEKELGAKISYSEKVSVADAEPALRSYAEQGYKVIFAHSFEYGDPVLKVAKDYPNTYFVVWTGIVAQSPNVASIQLLEQETGYVMGVLAGLMTKTNVVAAIGGSDLPTINADLQGYKAGAESVNPDVKVIITFAGVWDDPAKGKEAAFAQIEAGADVLYHIADKTGLGMIQAAQEKGVYAIGSAADQSTIAPNTVLCSSTEIVDAAYLNMVRAVLNGSFKPEVIKMGLALGAIDIAPISSFVPKDVQDKVIQAKNDIISGKIIVP
jgi:basic membrane protein A